MWDNSLVSRAANQRTVLTADPALVAAARVVAVLVVSVLLGALTSYAQGFLPDALSSFANSPSGWAILTVSAVWLARPGLVLGAILGAASFVLLVVGYTVASELRGLSYDPLFWSLVGIVTGPIIGACAAAVRGPRLPAAAVGSGVLAAVLMVDAIYGLTVVADTTSPVYWALVGVLGVILLVVVGVVRLKPAEGGRGLIVLQIGTTIVAIALGAAGYIVLNALLS